ncbi:nitrate reductase [Sinimarinibacterium sp. CAU 1509]|uniref:nitrate reductase n=1 Tax=Sinimarinibacterium sp. CAU 1509 TaxID=2562283 RepID=UPI0010AC7413|nr:nitrate reductase [Sinimarinibacterium sp. CAU 1509]TJY58177.1 nitrate reductase [Sinimarinibacterium sp. CAU 1509]
MSTGAGVNTTCPYCGTGCGVTARVTTAGVEVAGDTTHPANLGRLCVKGSALGETVVDEGRLLYPALRDRNSPNPPQRVSWETALDTVADGFARIMREHGPESVAWYVSGQLLTEDYYVANKLVKGFVGSANIDTNSRLCMSSAVAGHKRAFGEDIVPVSYEDLEDAELIVLVGSNTAWCHPVLYQRILKAKARRPSLQIVVIDPRRTATVELADLHVPLRAGSDVWLFNGLLTFLERSGATDAGFVSEHTRGVADALAAADIELETVAQQCGVDSDTLTAFYRLFARTEKVITCFSMGVNQSSAGTDKVNSIINCHLLTGRIGKPGMGPFSLTGQPNAMGGREVGGLANMLAAHMDLENPDHRALVQTFWNSPRIAEKPGLKAVELFEAIEQGRIKAVWIMATNPVVSLPDADQIKRALQRCEMVVVSDVIANTDTTPFADVLLPAHAWGEKDGTVTNSERCISRQRPFVPVAGEARPDWWALSEVARRWGYGEQFAYTSAHEIFDEHARLTACGNGDDAASDHSCARYLNLSGLTGLDRQAFDAMKPRRWPVVQGDADTNLRVFSDGRYYHSDRRARLVPTPPRLPAHATANEFPLVLNTGRVRDHWHTMTRTGLAPRLASHTHEPYVDIHPLDAAEALLKVDELARVTTRWGSLVARVRCSGEVQQGTIFVPIHWNEQFASNARVGALVNPVVDPVSGEPEFKHTPVRVEPFRVDWHGFVLSRGRLPMEGVTWWTRAAGAQFARYEVAGRQKVDNWPALARSALGVPDGADWIEYIDTASGVYRAAYVIEDRVEACLFVSSRPDLPSRAWLSSLFQKPKIDNLDRLGLLVGEPLDSSADTGPTICSCFGVGRNTITNAIEQGGCNSVEALGAKLRCGTNCGSCIPELQKLLVAPTATA